MKRLPPLSADRSSNPIDLAEEIMAANDWVFTRSRDDELVVEMAGQWTDYHIYLLWRGDVGALYFSLTFDARVPGRKLADAYELMSLVNSKLWIGHFDLLEEENCLMFRHTMLLRGHGGVTVEQLEDIFDAALMETERFYPAFQYLLWGGKSAKESLDVAIFETIGEA